MGRGAPRRAPSCIRMSCGARRFAPRSSLRGASRPALCPLPPAGHIACPLCFDEAKCVPFLKQILEVPKQHKISKNEKNAKSKPNCLSVYAFRFSLWSFQKSLPLSATQSATFYLRMSCGARRFAPRFATSYLRMSCGARRFAPRSSLRSLRGASRRALPTNSNYEIL